jgi:hypothetical protein
MTKEKLKSVFQLYLDMLNEQYPGRQAMQFDDRWTKRMFNNIPRPEIIGHLKYMCTTAIGFVDAGRIEKAMRWLGLAMRWLGFLQGVLWSHDFYTLDDLKNHSRPDPVPGEQDA